jgi:hypothetical protein
MTWTIGIGLAVTFSAVAAAVVVWFGRVTSPALPADVMEFVHRHGVPRTDDACRLVDRYISRTRRYRTTWCGAGVVAAVAIGAAWYGSISAGTTPNAPLADIGFMGLGAWFLGIVHAEAYNNRPRFHGARVATLEPRRDSRYRVRRAVTIVRLVTVLAVGLCSASLVLAAERRPYGAALALAAAAVVVAAEASQRGIVRRARPVTRPDLVAADEAIRGAAAEVVDLGAAGFLLVICGWQIIQLGLHLSPARAGAAASVAPAFVVASLIAVTTAGGMARLARRVTRPTAKQRQALAGAQSGPAGNAGPGESRPAVADR